MEIDRLKYIWTKPWSALLEDLLDNRNDLPFHISDEEMSCPSNITIQRCFINAIHFLKEREVGLPMKTMDRNTAKYFLKIKIWWAALLLDILEYGKGPYGGNNNTLPEYEITSLFHIVMNGLNYSHLQLAWHCREEKKNLENYLEQEDNAAAAIEKLPTRQIEVKQSFWSQLD